MFEHQRLPWWPPSPQDSTTVLFFQCTKFYILSLQNHSKKSTSTFTMTQTLTVIQWAEKATPHWYSISSILGKQGLQGAPGCNFFL